MCSLSRITALLLIWALLPGCTDKNARQKIGFDLRILNDEGLYGPPDGLRALHYEFCVPAGRNVVEEVTSIDPLLECREGRGRVNCRVDQLLCTGSTYQPGHKQILERLANLRYIDKIEQSFFE